MLDHTLKTYLRPTAPKIIPKLAHLLLEIEQYATRILDRHPIAGRETAGMWMLEHILGGINWTTFRQQRDDLDRLLHLLPLQEDLIRVFDPGATGLVCHGNFIGIGRSGREYVLPVGCIDYAQDLPINQGWEEWQKVRPFHVLYLDSPDLSLNAYFDILRYRNNQPAHAVVSIDAISLILQYAKYCDTHAPVDRVEMQDYLHRFVLYPAFLNDSILVWLRMFYTDLLTHVLTDGIEPTPAIIRTAAGGELGTQRQSVVDQVWQLARDALDHKLNPLVLLSSLAAPQYTMSQAYQYLRRYTDIPPLRQNFWVQYLRDLGWLNLVFATMALTKDFPLTQTAAIFLKRDLRLLQASKFWANIPDTVTRNYIETDLHDKLQQHLDDA